MTTDTAGRIAAINDRFRQTFIGGTVLLTSGITNLAPHLVAHIVERVQGHDSFEAANDPYGEHDFGIIEIDDAPRVFWKIEPYDCDLQRGAEDPADITASHRVLTIFLASEY